MREMAKKTGNADLEVFHLKGGVHRYVEEYGNDGHFEGKNFVFDTRQGVGVDDGGAASSQVGKGEVIVGQCLYCSCRYDTFLPDVVCTVCREQILLCPACKSEVKVHGEYHCGDHTKLKDCYFTNLQSFPAKELARQVAELEGLHEEIAVGRIYKAKRNTIRRQIEKIQGFEREEADGVACRSCGKPNCGGNCWGYFGVTVKDPEAQAQEKALKKVVTTLKQQHQSNSKSKAKGPKFDSRTQSSLEIATLNLALPLASHLSVATNLRQLPPYTRKLQFVVKGKNVGKQLRVVLLTVSELNLPDEVANANALKSNLILVNDAPSSPAYEAKSGDVIQRLNTYLEPPVFVPSTTSSILIETTECLTLNNGKLHVLNKPPSFPIEPNETHSANTLLVIAEGDLSLKPRELKPCLVNVGLEVESSGLTLASSDQAVLKGFQRAETEGAIKTRFVAVVKGDFRKAGDTTHKPSGGLVVNSLPISFDPSTGKRKVDTLKGKPTTSHFEALSYSEEKDETIISCVPLTNRPYQLRVHLEAMGYPVLGDEVYGGAGSVKVGDARFPSPDLEVKVGVVLLHLVHLEVGVREGRGKEADEEKVWERFNIELPSWCSCLNSS